MIQGPHPSVAQLAAFDQGRLDTADWAEVVLELRQFADEDAQHLLCQVLDVGGLHPLVAQPAGDERRVQRDEALPRGRIRPQPEALQQADRGVGQQARAPRLGQTT